MPWILQVTEFGSIGNNSILQVLEFASKTVNMHAVTAVDGYTYSL